MADLGDRIHRHFIDVSISEKKAGGIFPTLYLHNIPARHISHQSTGVLLLVYSAAWSQRSRSHSHARRCGVFRKVYPPAAACTNIVRIVRSVVLRGVRSNEGFDPISPPVAARYCRRLPCLCKRLAVDPGATAR